MPYSVLVALMHRRIKLSLHSFLTSQSMESLFKALSTVSHAQLAACLMERIRHEVSTDSMMNVAAETARAGSGASQVAAARTLADVANAVARTVSSTAAAVTYASTPVPPVSSSTSKNIVSILTHAIVILELAEPRSPVAQVYQYHIHTLVAKL